jgi:hypothetical protein
MIKINKYKDHYMSGCSIICRCGEILGAVVIPFEKERLELFRKFNVDVENVSRSFLMIDSEDRIKIKKEMQIILDKYTKRDRTCCRVELLTYCKIAEIIN